MRHLFTFLVFTTALIGLQAQLIIGERSAELMEANYAITGTATILEYDDGTVTFTLSEDFTTPQGPDVWIYLNDAPNAVSAVALVNLSNINHFSGELVLDVPPGTDLDANSTVVFYCLAFNQLWATGEFGEVTNPNPMPIDTCEASLVATDNWVTEVAVCLDTPDSNSVAIKNNINVSVGEEYVFLMTDTNEVVLEAVTDSFYNFSNTPVGTYRFYGVSYRGNLDVAIGAARQNTTASECLIHSGDELFLTVEVFQSCLPSSVNELLSARTNVYPNPVSSQLSIDLPANFETQMISVLSLNGVTLIRRTADPLAPRLHLATSALAAGTYVLVIQGKEGVIRKPFVVTR